MTEETKAIHRQTYLLHSYEVDQRGVAKPEILFSFMLDSAWAHANKSEFSYDALKAEGQLWVLSRFLAVFHKLPRWEDEITVETWGKGTEKLFGMRDFIVQSREGEKLISATSAWLVIDRKTSRIQRIDLLNSNFPLQLEKNALDIKLGKIETQPSEKTGFEYTVRYSDLDVNKHVSSSRYMQWILDSFPAELIEQKNLKSCEINFLSEARLNDLVFVSTAITEDWHYCDIRREGTELCRAKVVWE